jgi:hypothetical protein
MNTDEHGWGVMRDAWEVMREPDLRRTLDAGD